MKTALWDYTALVDAYVKRPDYAKEAVDELLAQIRIRPGASVCDVGAGLGHLTKWFARYSFLIIAVEPSARMRNKGKEILGALSNVRWVEGVAEQTGQPASTFDLVTFGSSFNVTNRQVALRETARILKPEGWFACLWNYRDLTDSLQMKIEKWIQSCLPDYCYGVRREDQSKLIEKSGLFEPVRRLEHRVLHIQTVEDCLLAWRSHATLIRQAGSKAEEIFEGISKILNQTGKEAIQIPYVTRIWFAKMRNR